MQREQDRETRRLSREFGREVERQADETQKAIERPLIQAFENFQKEASDTFFEIFRDGEVQAEEFADGLRDILARGLSEQLTTSLFGNSGLLDFQALLGLGGGNRFGATTTGLPATASREEVLEALRGGTEAGSRAGTEEGFLAALGRFAGFGGGGAGSIFAPGGGGSGFTGGLGGILGNLGGIAAGGTGGLLLSALGFSDSIAIGAGVGGVAGAALLAGLGGAGSFAGAGAASSLLGAGLGASLGSAALPLIGTIIGAAIGAVPGAVATIQSVNPSASLSGGLEFENNQVGQSSRTAAFSETLLSTLSVELAGAAAIGARREGFKFFNFGTSAGGPGVAGPFGSIAGSSTFGSGFTSTIAALDATIARGLNSDEIAGVSSLLQGNALPQSITEREPGDFLAAFSNILVARAQAALTEIETPEFGTAFRNALGPLAPPPGAVFGVANQFIEARADFQGLERVLSGDFVSQLEQDFANLNQQLSDASTKFAAFGLDFQRLVDAVEEGQRTLLDAFGSDLQIAILEFTDPLEAALRRQAEQQEDLLATAEFAEAQGLIGALADAERLSALQRAQIIEDFARQANGALQSVLDDIRFGEAGGRSVEQRFNASLEEFQRLQGVVEGDPADIAARNDLASIASTLLGLNPQLQGSTTAAFATTDLVESVIQGIVDTPAATGGSTAALQEQQVSIAGSQLNALEELTEKIEELTEVAQTQAAEIAELRSDLGRAQAGTA